MLLSAERAATPLPQELYALLHFLRAPGPAQTFSSWRKAMAAPGRLVLLQRCLRPLMLRRTKATRDLDGQPILSLPERSNRLLLVTPLTYPSKSCPESFWPLSASVVPHMHAPSFSRGGVVPFDTCTAGALFGRRG